MLENFWAMMTLATWEWKNSVILPNVGGNWVSVVNNWVQMLSTFWDICFSLVVFFDRQKNPNQPNSKLRIQDAKNSKVLEELGVCGLLLISLDILYFTAHS